MTCPVLLLAVALQQRRADEAGEQRVRRERLALEFGVELAAHEVRVFSSSTISTKSRSVFVPEEQEEQPVKPRGAAQDHGRC